MLRGKFNKLALAHVQAAAQKLPMGSHHGKTKTTTIAQLKELHEAYKAMERKGHTCQLGTVHRKSTRLNDSLLDKKTVPTKRMVGVVGKYSMSAKCGTITIWVKSGY